MTRSARSLSLAATSLLGIATLGIGLATPAMAAPSTTPSDESSIAAVSELLAETDLLDPTTGPTDEELERVAKRQASTAQFSTAAVRSVTPTAEEVSRTATSVTFRFTLPEGELTRDDAVLQAFSEVAGFRVSQLSYLTDPSVGYGASAADGYDEQLAQIQLATLLRENFSVVGATPTSRVTRDHFTVPAGRNAFQISINSARTETQFRDELRAITGVQPTEEGFDPAEFATQLIFGTRMALPDESATWTYGDRISVYRSIYPGQKFPNGSGELTATRTARAQFDATTTVRRADGQPFSGIRVLALDPYAIYTAALPDYGGTNIVELVQLLYPSPLRVGAPTTVVTGASLVRDGFYLPDSGADTVTARTFYSGFSSIDEARDRYADWVTDTCEASLDDPIPGFTGGEGGAPVTWQAYFDDMFDDDDAEDAPGDEEQSTESPVYTGTQYIDAVYDDARDRADQVQDLFPGVDITSEESLAALTEMGAFWDEACGTADDGGDPGEGQFPAELTLDVPSTGVAGSPLTLAATVTDNQGNPVPGQQVTFTISEDGAGTLKMAATGARLAPAAKAVTTLTATSDSNGVSRVVYTPSTSGTLRVSASTGGAEPVTSETDSSITVTPAPGDGDGGDTDADEDASSGSGSLGSIFGSLSS